MEVSKVCRECKIIKLISKFSNSQLVKKNSKCKECIRISDKKYKETRKTERYEYNKQYREKNTKKVSDSQKEYRKNNKEKKRISDREYKKNRRKNDALYALRVNYSVVVGNSLKKGGGSKNGASCFSHLMYDLEELRAHIESQFEPWMNWSNRGKYNPKTWNDKDQSTWVWQLDHIIPLSDLPHDNISHPNFKIAWALSNLRPLSAKQNHLDGVKRSRHLKLKSHA